ncbi:uncharacterized protein LOC143564661 [Bidens hawaiensis]|uniref:uncharacterized protein LOC143564661 n=1 Tax=Bidens hawaiensis TaxID=980011 RepID=UPI004049DE13
MIESERLFWVRHQQKHLRCESYENLRNLHIQGNTDVSSIGTRLILPSSLTGGARYMMQNYLDAMALFVYIVEFQKRGLPHAHICLFLHHDHKLPVVDDVDQFICAEIPDEKEDPTLYSLVKEFMIHGPCGAANLKCSCMINKRCSKNFPKKFCNATSLDSDGFPIYRRRDCGSYVERSNIHLDNRSVVPYNKELLKRYQAHINVEWYNQAGSIKYLFKYINKGPDRATVSVVQNNEETDQLTEKDEIKEYYDCRYISACEASWRIFAFDIHYRYPSVMRLPFHLPGQQQVVYEPDEGIEDVLEKASLKAEQRLIYDDIIKAVEGDNGGVFFVYGYGGTGGRTSHSRFGIPINLTEVSTCGIKKNTDAAHLLKKTKLIIWDEAPMTHKHAFEALDRTLRDMLGQNGNKNFERPFGGKVVVFCGDFRQTLPVVQGGTRQELVNSSLCSSYLWGTCKLLKLTKNMRLTVGSDKSKIQEMKEFANWLLDLGEGKLGGQNDGDTTFDVPDDLLIKDTSVPMSQLIDLYILLSSETLKI